MLGGLIGLLARRFAGLPFIAALFPVPKIALLPLLILWFGIGEASMVAVIARCKRIDSGGTPEDDKEKSPMIKPRRIGHATFETPDLEKAIAYYEKFMGLIVAEREKDRAFLASKVGPLAIQLNKADRAHCIKLSFEVAPNSDFGELARELAKDGVRSELRNDSIPGIGQVLSFQDDKGTTIELFKDWSYLGKHEQVAGIGPLKLGHVAFFTPDIQRTVAFYEKVLGFRVSDWIGDFFCFMRCNPDHHTVNFFTGPKPSSITSPSSSRISCTCRTRAS